MSLGNTLATAVLVLLLGTSLAAANTAVLVDRTVLDADYMKQTLEEEDAYGTLNAVAIETTTEQIENETVDTPLPVDPETVVDEAVREAYVRRQTERNIDRLYGYLDGERDELVLSIDLAPVKSNIAASVGDEIRDRSLAELMNMSAADVEEATVQVEGTTLNPFIVSEMAESESSYRAARADFRADVRLAVIGRMVDEAYRSRSDDELLALVIEDYDPDAYTAAEKARMVDDREAGIKAALERTIEREAGAEIDRAVEDSLDRYRMTLRSEVQGAVEARTAGLDPAISEAVVDVAMVGITGLTTDMTYPEFTTELAAAKDRLAEAAAGSVEAGLDEAVADRVDLTEGLDPGAMGAIRTARDVAGAIDLLVYGLAGFALVLVGGLWVVSRAVVTTALGAGLGAASAGATGVVLAAVASERLRAAPLSGGEVPELGELIVGVASQVLGALTAQSALLAVVGVLALGMAAGLHLGVLPVGRATGGPHHPR